MFPTSVLQRVDFKVVLVLQILQALNVLIRHLTKKNREEAGSINDTIRSMTSGHNLKLLLENYLDFVFHLLHFVVQLLFLHHHGRHCPLTLLLQTGGTQVCRFEKKSIEKKNMCRAHDRKQSPAVLNDSALYRSEISEFPLLNKS